ncbi:MAG: N-6 DNA methylase, partial [Euryarchaeota archaeon]|nr:N-6 DNA methylase [Euryarchaeota archaeon]
MGGPNGNTNDGSDLLGFEEDLWDAANKLRGNIDAAEYKHYVLPLIFLKYISDAFEDRRKQIIAEGRDPTQRIRYSSELVFWVPEEALWNSIAKKARSPSIDHDLDSAMEAIERENPHLTGVLKKDFSTSDLSTRILGELVDLFSNISISFADEDARSKDVIGRVYEYFLHRFAGAEKRGGGEFYTPRSVVNLLVHALSPHSGSIYDGCFGSAGMFVQSEEFLRVRQATLDSMVYGQESNPTTWKLGKMNLVIRGIEADLGEGPEDTLYRDWHEDKLFDFCMVNPPFNIKEWGNDLRPERWDYGVPPDSNANFAWIQHYLQHLKPSGFAGIVMSNGSLSASGVQG